MAWYLQVDEDEPAQVATIAGLRSVREIVDAAPVGGIPELRHLLAHGWSQNVADLRAEIEGLEWPAALRPTADAMLAALRDDATVASLTDGMGPAQEGDE